MIGTLAVLTVSRPTAALTGTVNAYPNVGVVMVWRDATNPLGLPAGLADVTVVLTSTG